MGTPAEIYDEPADTFVASFLGSPPMNLLPQGERLLGFRPEHFLPRELVGESHGLVPFNFEVTRMEYLGADRLAYGLVQGPTGPTKIISRIPSTATATIEAGPSNQFE